MGRSYIQQSKYFDMTSMLDPERYFCPGSDFYLSSWFIEGIYCPYTKYNCKYQSTISSAEGLKTVLLLVSIIFNFGMMTRGICVLVVPHHCGFKSHQGLWNLLFEAVILLANETFMVLLKCSFVPEWNFCGST
jgi:predicted membrane protein